MSPASKFFFCLSSILLVIHMFFKTNSIKQWIIDQEHSALMNSSATNIFLRP